MNINPLANKKPARRFFVLVLIFATAVSIAYITSRIILDTQKEQVEQEIVAPKSDL